MFGLEGVADRVRSMGCFILEVSFCAVLGDILRNWVGGFVVSVWFIYFFKLILGIESG